MGGRQPRRGRSLLKARHRTRTQCSATRSRGRSCSTTALTHPSAAVGSDVHYERLEFLGDAVLDLAIADLLMRRFPTAKEGPLSKQRASIVNARTLALKAQAIELNEMMRLGKGEEKSGGRDKISILAAAFEAVIGAIYTDGGLAPAQRVVERLFDDDIGGPAAERDYKTELQEVAYRAFSRAAGVRAGRGERSRSRQALYHSNPNRGARTRRGRRRQQETERAGGGARSRWSELKRSAVNAMDEHRAGFVAVGGPHQRRQINAGQSAGRAQGRDRDAAAADHAPANPRNPQRRRRADSAHRHARPARREEAAESAHGADRAAARSRKAKSFWPWWKRAIDLNPGDRAVLIDIARARPSDSRRDQQDRSHPARATAAADRGNQRRAFRAPKSCR